MNVTAAVLTDRGRVRGENQDSYAVSSALGLYVVADGMGGRAAGKRASEQAVTAVVEAVRASGGEVTGGERLRNAIVCANRDVWELAESDPHLYGMATTIAAVLVEKEVAHIGHVGDSRVYLVRGNDIRALTRDHSMAAELADRGVPADAVARSGQTGLSRAVGAAPSVDPTLGHETIGPGDVIVVCSDGIYKMLEPEELRTLVASEPDPARACAAVVARANDAGGPDNSTIIVVRCIGDGDRPGGAS